MIEKLKWDSHFFKYNVGKLNIKNSINTSAFIKLSSTYRLIYIFSDHLISEFEGLKFMENKITFHKKINSMPNPLGKIEVFDIKKDSKDELIQLAYLSGIKSRFNKDDNFSEYEFKKIYAQWIENCLDKKSNSKILVVKDCQKIIGFTTVECLDTESSKIGLIAVDKRYQRKGIAKQLMTSAENISIEKKCTFIEVTTQGDNKPATNFYQNYGFNVIFTKYIYHYWNAL